MRRLPAILATAVLFVLLLASSALAYDEPDGMLEQHTGSGGVLRDCVPCHRLGTDGSQCSSCHAPHMGLGLGETAGKGPHGIYTATTDRCDACHDTHDANGADLLPGNTVTASCYSCHDGTGGKGVYGAIAARGLTPAARHRVDTTSTVPGGDAVTGGNATMSFSGPGGTMGCDDCHSPHDANTVAPFTSERQRTTYMPIFTAGTATSKLLRRNPGGSTATATVYGSDWCGACHKGRLSGSSMAGNHPVESLATTGTPFSYASLQVLASDAPTSVTTTGTLSQSNRGYLMPYPRTARQSGHAPICQQCHEDSRFVGSLATSGAPADAATYSVTATDGLSASDNPRFQNFPHETVNRRFLVEDADDLCLNCHPPAVLP